MFQEVHAQGLLLAIGSAYVTVHWYGEVRKQLQSVIIRASGQFMVLPFLILKVRYPAGFFYYGVVIVIKTEFLVLRSYTSFCYLEVHTQASVTD